MEERRDKKNERVEGRGREGKGGRMWEFKLSPPPGGRMEGWRQQRAGKEKKKPDELIQRHSGFSSLSLFFNNKQQQAAKLLSDQSVTPREDERMKRQPHSLSSNQFSSLSCQ